MIHVKVALFGSKFVNNICFADDPVILCPSVKSLNSLLAKCSYYAISHDIIFNTEKSQSMLFKSKDFKLKHIPNIQLQGSKLDLVNTCTYVYLYHLITCDLTEDADILRQRRLLCIVCRSVSLKGHPHLAILPAILLATVLLTHPH